MAAQYSTMSANANTMAHGTPTMTDQSTTGAAQDSTQTAQGAQADSEDYFDKFVDFIERKLGMDPGKMRAQNEKYTDMARTQFEKMTGKKVPAKFSN